MWWSAGWMRPKRLFQVTIPWSRLIAYVQLYTLFLFVNINKVHVFVSLTLKLPDQICYSPHCQPYNSNYVSSENLVLYQLMIPKLIFFFILITCLVDIEENGFHVYIAWCKHTGGNHDAKQSGFQLIEFYISTILTILHFFYKITDERASSCNVGRRCACCCCSFGFLAVSWKLGKLNSKEKLVKSSSSITVLKTNLKKLSYC